LKSAEANEELRGFNSKQYSLFSSGGWSAGDFGGVLWRRCDGVVRLLEIVDVRHAILCEIEETPAIELIAAARVSVRDHDRVLEDLVLRLKARLDGNDGRHHLRFGFDPRDDFFLDDPDRSAGHRDEQPEN